MNTYIFHQKKLIENEKLPKGVCSICGENDPRVLKEYHHIFGKSIGKEKILLCHNCHDKITYEQNKFPPKIRKSLSNISKIVFSLKTQGALLELIGKKQTESADMILEEWKKCQK